MTDEQNNAVEAVARALAVVEYADRHGIDEAREIIAGTDHFERWFEQSQASFERPARAAITAMPAPSDQEKLAKDNFLRGYLIACSSLIGGYGATDYAEYLLKEIGEVSNDDLTRLDLCDYDQDNLRPILTRTQEPTA